MGKQEKETFEFIPGYSRKPHCCPVCNGEGKVSQGFYGQNVGIWGRATVAIQENCRSCGGSGIVWG